MGCRPAIQGQSTQHLPAFLPEPEYAHAALQALSCFAPGQLPSPASAWGHQPVLPHGPADGWQNALLLSSSKSSHRSWLASLLLNLRDWYRPYRNNSAQRNSGLFAFHYAVPSSTATNIDEEF